MAKKTKNIEFYEGIGRRKQSVARVRLYLTKSDKSAVTDTIKMKAGEVTINNTQFDKYIPAKYERDYILLPLKATDNEARFAISVRVEGGGKTGQIDAIVHGLARALEKVDKESYRPILKKQGFLHRDPRKKERRKVGTGGKARRAKQSPKR